MHCWAQVGRLCRLSARALRASTYRGALSDDGGREGEEGEEEGAHAGSWERREESKCVRERQRNEAGKRTA